jgi:predicted dehydrogenase
MNKIRIGIIGYGAFAERSIAPAIRSSRNSELIAIQKRDRVTAAEKAVALSIPLSFSTVDELVRHPEVDAVYIASANSAHHSETLTAAAAGKHIIVEKPMAMDGREAAEMISACEKANVQLMVAHMLRFSPLISRMKDSIRLGEIGDVISASSGFMYDAGLSQRKWLYDRAVAGGGPVYDIGVHCIDTLRFLLDDEVTDISAILHPSPTSGRTEDTGIVTLRFSKGMVASVYSSFRAPFRRTFIEVVGTKGVLRAFQFTTVLTTVQLIREYESPGGRIDSVAEKISIPNLYITQIEKFAESILEGKASPISGVEGLRNQEILDRVFNSHS